MNVLRFGPVCVTMLLIAGCAQTTDSTGEADGPAMPTEPGKVEGFFTGADGLRLYYVVRQGAPDSRADPIVVIHGGPGCDSGYMLPDLEPLVAEYGRTLVFYDQRGGGRSDLPDEPSTMLAIDRHVADLEALREHLGLERMTLLAHSFGPLLAASYAIEHPDRVRRMIFIGALPPRRADVWRRHGDAVAAILSEEETTAMERAYEDLLSGPDPVEACRRFWAVAMKPRVADPAKIALVRGDLCSAPAEAIRYGMAHTNPRTLESLGDWDLRERLAAVNAPTLIVHGEHETIAMDLVEEWTSALPDARLMRVPEAAHFPYVERADLVWPAIAEFLGP